MYSWEQEVPEIRPEHKLLTKAETLPPVWYARAESPVFPEDVKSSKPGTISRKRSRHIGEAKVSSSPKISFWRLLYRANIFLCPMLTCSNHSLTKSWILDSGAFQTFLTDWRVIIDSTKVFKTSSTVRLGDGREVKTLGEVVRVFLDDLYVGVRCWHASIFKNNLLSTVLWFVMSSRVFYTRCT